MRVLILHNSYGRQAPSGENEVVRTESEVLERAGHRVILETVSNDLLYEGGSYGLAKAAVRTPWSSIALANLRRRVEQARPDIVHIHNTFPLLTPSVFHIGRNRPRRFGVVCTVHNYRMFCAAGNCMRNGALCTECVGASSPWRGALYGCYRGRRTWSLPVALMIGLHRALKTYATCPDALILQSTFQAGILARSGIPKEKLHVKPHCIIPKIEPRPWEERSGEFLFLGRLSKEKGLDLLIEVWARLGVDAPTLTVVGSGADRGRYESLCRDRGLCARIRFAGMVSEADKWRMLGDSRCLLMPTQWYETFGLVIGEAYSVGVPALVSNLGCLPEVVGLCGQDMLLPADSIRNWADAVCRMQLNPQILLEKSRLCRAEYEARFAEGGQAAQLERIYAEALRIASGGVCGH